MIDYSCPVYVGYDSRESGREVERVGDRRVVGFHFNFLLSFSDQRTKYGY